jgi:hypothetical protein
VHGIVNLCIVGIGHLCLVPLCACCAELGSGD